MEHLKKDLILDRVYANELFVRWIRSDGDHDYIQWLRILVMHLCEGGGANAHVEELKKTIVVLLNAEREDVSMDYEYLSNIKKRKFYEE